MVSEVIYVEVCPTLTPLPTHSISDGFCTVYNSTHMLCNSWNGMPSFNSVLFTGVITGIIVAGLMYMVWYLFLKVE